tara:strand:- start:46946 stop:48907 length:1962 start_codon:yes stop_codon:yes gene_type:complete
MFFHLQAEKAISQNDPDILGEMDIFEKFGTLTHEDLQIQANHNFPYEYILKESSIRMLEEGRSLIAAIDYLIRIKVYSDDPIQQAEASLVGIPFYFADGIESVQHIEGITYQPDGRVSVLQENQLRFVELNSRYRMIEFELPDVEQGSVLEYKYRLERRYIEELPDFYFSERVPTRKAELNFQNSNLIRYNIIEENADFGVQYAEQRVDTSSVPLIFTYRRPESILLQRWTAENIPAMDTDSYVSSIDDVRGKLKFQISEFGIPRQPLENSWEFVTAQILRNNNPYEFINLYPHLNDLGSQFSENLSDLTSIQDSVFAYVNSHVQFNGQNSIFAERGLNHVLDGEPSNQAEINLTLLALLRGAGIDAYPMYISGREFGRINREFPSLFQFNRVLIASEIDGKTQFMDASFPNSLPGLITIDSNNGDGMIVRKDHHEWIAVEPDLSRFMLDIELNATLNDRGDLNGTILATAFGYPSRNIREDLQSGRAHDRIISETFFDVYPETILNNSVVEIDSENPDKVQLMSDFSIRNYSVTFSDGIEFRPMVVGYLFSNPFESEERRIPITLDGPESINIQYNIELPRGYSFDVAGDTRSTSLPKASLLEEYFMDGNQIEYSFDIEIRSKDFPAENYAELRKIYNRWVQLSNETWIIDN